MSISTELRNVAAIRYVTPLREGGSLPGLVEADDDGLYVVKFRGAGQGPRALLAEVIVGELARRLGLLVPELVTIEIDPVLGAAEPDPEIQELITASAGANLGVDFLPGALPYTPAGPWRPDERLAADIVWLDALTTNVDFDHGTVNGSTVIGSAGTLTKIVLTGAVPSDTHATPSKLDSDKDGFAVADGTKAPPPPAS